MADKAVLSEAAPLTDYSAKILFLFSSLTVWLHGPKTASVKLNSRIGFFCWFCSSVRNTMSVTRSRTDLRMPSLKPAIYVAIPHPQLLFEIYVGQEKHISNFRPYTNQNTENSWKHASSQSAFYTLSTSFLAATGSVVCRADCDTVEQLLVSSNGREPETIIIFSGHWNLTGLTVNRKIKRHLYSLQSSWHSSNSKTHFFSIAPRFEKCYS